MPEEHQTPCDELHEKEQLLEHEAHMRDGTPNPATVVIIPPIPDGPPEKGWPPCGEEPGDPADSIRKERGAVGDWPLVQ